jgi:hypothetical protein
MTDSLFSITRDAFRARAGRRLAQDEIGSLINGSLQAKDLPGRRPPFFAEEERMRNIKHAYVIAWREQWLLQAHSDAERGVYRGDLFDNPHYRQGWLFAVQRMRDRGFRHAANDRIFEDLLAHR